MNKLTVMILGSAMFATACSTTQTMADRAKDMADAQKVRDAAIDERQHKDQARMEKEIKQIPDWAMQAPAPDQEGIYAIGMGSSDDLRISIRKAFLDGEYGLARSTNQMISGSERSYSKDANNRVEHQEYRALIDSLVTNVPVVGVQTINQQTMPVNGLYNTYVLVKLPYKELNRAMQAREAQSEDQTVKQAFAELYARLDKAEKKASQESQAKQAKQTVVASQSTVSADTPKDPTAVLKEIIPASQPTLDDKIGH